MERETYNDPTVIRRLRREDQIAHAMILPHTQQTRLVWWIDEKVEAAEDFIEWAGALERAEVVRARFMKDGWTHAK